MLQALAAKVGARRLGRASCAIGRAIRTGVAMGSPMAAQAVSAAADQWIVPPVNAFATTISSWVSGIEEIAWELSQTTHVRRLTVRAAKVASILIAIHSLTRGAAARLVQALPWPMGAVLILTNPVRRVAMVAAAFVADVIVAVVRFFTSAPQPPANGQHDVTACSIVPTSSATSTTPAPSQPTAASEVGHCQPKLTVVPPVADAEPAVDLDAIAAELRVDVAPDGSVIVNRIPSDLPPEVDAKVAKIAADAAVAQQERIFKLRRTPNRDDRHLLTKAAREAVRAEAGRGNDAA